MARTATRPTAAAAKAAADAEDDAAPPADAGGAADDDAPVLPTAPIMLTAATSVSQLQEHWAAAGAESAVTKTNTASARMPVLAFMPIAPPEAWLGCPIRHLFESVLYVWLACVNGAGGSAGRGTAGKARVDRPGPLPL